MDMNTQEIATILIVAIASGYGILSLFRVLFPRKSETKHGCSSNCNCDAVKMRKELLANRKSERMPFI
jgi:hypothetical protein